MKKLFVLAISAMLMGGAALAQGPQGTTQQNAAKPSLTWKTTNINLGKIPQGKPATAKFEFTNSGLTPVVLKTVQPSCGCTTAGYTKEPVAPGKEGTVSATYNAAAVGNFTKSVTVTPEGGDAIVLIISGEVIAGNNSTPGTGGH
jgi:hypothetical protein